MFLILTAAADTGEGQGAAFDVAAATFFPVVPGHGDLMQVDDRIAAGADEVDMGVGVGIEPFHTLHRGHTHDLAFGLKLGQVSAQPKSDLLLLETGHNYECNHFHHSNHLPVPIGCNLLKNHASHAKP